MIHLIPILLAAAVTVQPYYTPLPNGSARIDWPTVCKLAAEPYPAAEPRNPLGVTAARIEWASIQVMIRTAASLGKPPCDGDKAR